MQKANGSAKKPEPMSTHTGFSTGQWYQAPAPIYRFWSSNYQRHFYTISKAERDHIIAHDHNWAYEGIAFEAFKDGNNVYSESPVYRLWRNSPPGHFYTISYAERNAVLASGGWNDEGTAYRAFTWNKTGTSPLYRFWNGSTQSHFYTASQGERDYLIAHSNDWSYEGIGYYILN